MLRQVADGVLVNQSIPTRQNTVVVHGRAGVLLIFTGVTIDELTSSRTTSGNSASRWWPVSQRTRTGIICFG